MKMKQAAAKPKTTTSAENGLEQLIDESSANMARTQVLASLLSMGWRLAVAILVPILVGLNLDNRFDSKPKYVMTGFFLAIGLASYMIYVEYRDIQAKQMAQDASTAQSSRKSSVSANNKKGNA